MFNSFHEIWSHQKIQYTDYHSEDTQFLSGLAKTKLTRQQFDNIKRGVLLIS